MRQPLQMATQAKMANCKLQLFADRLRIAEQAEQNFDQSREPMRIG